MRKIFFIFCLSFISLLFFSLEYFRGYFDEKKETIYSIESLLQLKSLSDDKCSENYFHEAQFKEQGITIFTNIIFSKTFIDKNDCKIHCTITFKDGSKYLLNKDFNKQDLFISKESFYISFKNNYIKYSNKLYTIHVEDEKIDLTLNYKVINPPQIFGDGIITLNSKNYMALSWPIVGAIINGRLIFNGNETILSGRGSIGHDYYRLSPLNNPRKWRSFWFYNKNYTVHIHSIILTDGNEIDRVSIYKDGNLIKNFLNTGLELKDFLFDYSTNFTYPSLFLINSKYDKTALNAVIKVNEITDRIQAFSSLTPGIHKLVSLTVGEMWVYRFWCDAKISLIIDGKEENIEISGLGHFVDTDKELNLACK